MAGSKERSYARALDPLNSIASNRTVTSMVGKNAGNMNSRAIPEMVEWLRKAGFSLDDLKRLKVVHVAGTKGKGSTTAIIACILKAWRDGLEPHKRALQLQEFLTRRVSEIGGRGTRTSDGGKGNAYNDRWTQQELSHAVELSLQAGYSIDDWDRLKCLLLYDKQRSAVDVVSTDFSKLFQEGKTTHLQNIGSRGSVDSSPCHSSESQRGSTTQLCDEQASVTLGDIGMYTSPHLISVRERIMINGQPISQADFTNSFFRVWDSITEATQLEGKDDPSAAKHRPGYFRYLTIMAFDIFLSKGIRTVVMECGIGGEYDSTNILPAEAKTVAVVTKIGIDHVDMLGNTLQSIAWHKAGIFKPGVRAVTTRDMPHEAVSALQDRADELLTVGDQPGQLQVVDPEVALACNPNPAALVALEGLHQRKNAVLAMEAAHTYLQALGSITELDPDVRDKDLFWKCVATEGLAAVKWPGRSDTRIDDHGITWYIDGAHTEDSLISAARWYAQKSMDENTRILIFNQQIRDAIPLFRVLHRQITQNSGILLSDPLHESRAFHHAIFCTNNVFRHENAEDVSYLSDLAQESKSCQPMCDVAIRGSIEEAVEIVRSIAAATAKPVEVFVTGSLHLVGGVLTVLNGHTKNDDSWR